MSVTQLVKSLRQLRQLRGLFFKIVSRILCRIDLRHSRPRPPGEGRQEGGQQPDQSPPSSSLLSYTVAFDGAIVPLHDALFSINPRSAGDSFRNSSTVGLSLPNRQHGSQLSLRLSSKSVASIKTSNNHVASLSASPAPSTSSLPSCNDDPQESADIRHSGQRIQLPERQETQPIGIEVQAPNESPTSPYIHDAPPVLSNEPLYMGPNHPSHATLQVPGARTPQLQQPSSRPGSIGGIESTPYSTLTPDPNEYGLYPAIPSETLRYKWRKKIEKKETDLILSPQDCTAKRFLRGLDLPPGWKRLIHPEGGCYFYHLASRIYTDNEIYDPEELERIQDKIYAVNLFKRTINDFPREADTVLNIYETKPEDNGEKRYQTQCYCINHADRMIFFLSPFHAKWIETWGEVEGAYSRHHFRHELEAQYWKFVHLYPDSIKLTKAVIDDVKDTLFFFNGDVTTSPYSTSPYESVEITDLLNILPMLEGHIESETSTVGGVEFIARIMFLICHNRFLNFYGEPCARLERDFSVYGDALFPRTLLLRSVSLVLFSAPDVHLTNLQKMWVDKMLHTGVWKKIMTTFSSEWQELVTYSTIMLNANVAFLAIQSVDNPAIQSADNPAPSRSWAQIFSYASTIANLACMILGLLLMRQNQTKKRETADLVYKYLEKQYSELTGLEALAIMFSLPYASLMWGMVSFFVAFSLMCVMHANKETRIVVITCLVLAILYITWCIYLAWETNPKDTSQDNRTFAYSQQAEIDKAEEDRKNAEEFDDGKSDDGDETASSSSRPATDDTSSHPRRRIPGMEAIRSLWDAFLIIFIPRNNPDVERGEIRENIELRAVNTDQAPNRNLAD